jgi:hypothetical protein
MDGILGTHTLYQPSSKLVILVNTAHATRHISLSQGTVKPAKGFESQDDMRKT